MKEHKGRGNTIPIPDGFMTAGKLAQEVGVHKDTITRWRKDGLLHPEAQQSGEITVYLFSDADYLVAINLAAGKQQRLVDRLAEVA